MNALAGFRIVSLAVEDALALDGCHQAVGNGVPREALQDELVGSGNHRIAPGDIGHEASAGVGELIERALPCVLAAVQSKAPSTKRRRNNGDAGGEIIEHF